MSENLGGEIIASEKWSTGKAPRIQGWQAQWIFHSLHNFPRHSNLIHWIENFSNRCVWFLFCKTMMICPPAFSGYLFIQCSSLFRKNSFPSCASLCIGCVLSIYFPTSSTLQTQCKSCLKFCIKIHPECPRLLPVSVGDTRLQSIPGPYFFFLILWTFQVARDFIMLSWLSAIHISGWIGKFNVSRLPVEWDRHFCNHAELGRVGPARQ